MEHDQQFWNQQTSSLHRADDPRFYRRKAEEHASLVPSEERSASCVDLGCGAGELLLHLLDHMNVDVGLDYSETMLGQARKNLSGKTIDLICGNIFEYLPGSRHFSWITTGAINQYLDTDSMYQFLDMFKDNNHAKSLYMYDCVDPLRFKLLNFGISYRPKHSGVDARSRSLVRHLSRAARQNMLGAKLAFGHFNRSCQKLSGEGMGFGYLPRFWLLAAAERKLFIEIVSSRYYEYRYHVLFRKEAPRDVI